MPTGHYTDRRAFGNVSRLFRGARIGDPFEFTGLLDDFGGAAFAATHVALSREWVSNATDEVRRSSDSDVEAFTESQILSGAMLSFVNHDTTSLYNSARFFNGTSTKVIMDSSVTVTGNFTISVKFMSEDTTTTKSIIATDNFNKINILNGQVFVAIDGVSSVFGGVIVSAFETYTLTVSRIGSDVTVSVEGVGSETKSLTSGDFIFSAIGSQVSGANFWSGVIYDVNVNDQAAYTGLGTSVTAWEDTTENNDGTETNGAAYTGQPFNGFEATSYDQSGVTVRNATQATTTEQPKIVDAGAVVLDGNGNTSTAWDGIDDDLDVIVGFAGLTSANVYAVTDNAGVVTLDTLTAQNISAATNLSTILTSLTYDKVTAVIIYPDATDQAGIEASLNETFGT